MSLLTATLIVLLSWGEILFSPTPPVGSQITVHYQDGTVIRGTVIVGVPEVQHLGYWQYGTWHVADGVVYHWAKSDYRWWATNQPISELPEVIVATFPDIRSE